MVTLTRLVVTLYLCCLLCYLWELNNYLIFRTTSGTGIFHCFCWRPNWLVHRI